MAASRKSDVLILGGGVIGLACAHYLLKAGRNVTIIEQNTLASGSSHGNCGTITPSHAPPLAQPGMIAKALKWMLTPDAPFRVAPRLDLPLFEWMLQFARHCNWRDYERIAAAKAPLLLRSRQLIGELVQAENLDCEFAQSGTLYVHRDAAAFEQASGMPKMLAELGIVMQVIDAARCREMEPALNDSIVGGYFNPGDARLRPDRYAAELARVVEAKGGEIIESTRIDGFRIEHDRIGAVLTDHGEFNAQDIVFALGAWSPQLGRKLGLRIPIQPGKGYSITYTRPPRAPRIPLTLRERSVCVTAWDSGYRLGSTMEFAGYDASLNRARLDALKRGAAEYLIEAEGPQVVEEWYGWRPMTYDDLPILGRAANLKNLMLATGHGMLGVTLSAVTGEMIAQLLSGRESVLDPAPFSPARFGI
ncbi:MAG TPA: FAD-dependent oxidoreductase [Rudaea sp.]|uniref:NAD(P)/FAD-dependent oxidoreductase n=1 Tax=Rudaea sp. TaxID=2136325 RepID=UPI002F921241